MHTFSEQVTMESCHWYDKMEVGERGWEGFQRVKQKVTSNEWTHQRQTTYLKSCKEPAMSEYIVPKTELSLTLREISWCMFYCSHFIPNFKLRSTAKQLFFLLQ